MKKVLALIFCSIFISGNASAGVVFEIESTEFDGGQSEQTILRASVQNMDLRMQVDSSSDMIFRGSKGEMLMIDHSEKSYVVIDNAMMDSLGNQMSAIEAQMQEALKDVPAEQRAMMEQMMKQHMPKAATEPQKPMVELKKTGERAEKNGYDTEKYVMFVAGTKTQEMWIADWDDVEGGDEAAVAFKEMAAFFSGLRDALPSFAQSGVDESVFEYLNELDGFPVVTVSYGSNGAKSNESVLRSSKSVSIASSEFDAPAGYARQRMPGS